MKRYFNIFLSLAAVAALGSCSKENPFDNNDDLATGKFLKSSLAVQLQNEEGIYDNGRKVRAAAPEVKDFTVEFVKEGEAQPEASYLYSEMPEIVVLPVGSYTVKAFHGDNASAAWENPYYYGSGDIDIVKDDITEAAAPIVCSLANVRVSIDFDPVLRANMSADSKVTVKVGESGSLDFTLADTERSGYFAYVENSKTLTATFNGTVEGYETVETKAYDNVNPGHHYRITFTLHTFPDEDPGDINAGLKVDASVESEDMNVSVDPGQDILPDDMRPGEDWGEEPNPPTPPIGEAPVIKAEAPVDLDGVNVVEVNGDGVSTYPVELLIESTSGIIEFTVDINSNTLTPDELDGVGLASRLDLVNPGAFKEGLQGLGFPVEVGGMKSVRFSITDFVPLLAALGPGTHEFKLTVTDKGGTTVKTLILETK